MTQGAQRPGDSGPTPARRTAGPAPRILLLRGGAIGDFILSLPAVSVLRREWPDAWIEVAANPHAAHLAGLPGVADAVRPLDTAEFARLFAPAPVLPQDQRNYLCSFDLVISYLHDPEGIVHANLLHAGARELITASPMVAGLHACDFLARPLADLVRLPVNGLVPDLRLPAALTDAGRDRLRGLRRPVLAIHPGSGSARKNWPLPRFLALAEAVRRDSLAHPVFLAGEADTSLRTAISASPLADCLLPELPLTQIAAVLTAADAYLGNDSGITHLAAAVGTPTAAIYGPSDPEVWGARGRSRVERIASPRRTAESLRELPLHAVLPRVLELIRMPAGESL